MSLTSVGIVVVAIVVLLLLLAVVFKSLYRVPGADQALVITGAGAGGAVAGTNGRTYKIVTGGGALVIPILQRAQYISMKADKTLLHVDGVDSQKIPVGVRGVAIFKIADDPQSITNAATRFLNDQKAQDGATSQMHDLVREVFHGHLRSIIGGLSVEDLIANRNELSQQARDASKDELERLGLAVESLQIQEIDDPTGYIKALGEPRAAEVKALARVAEADRNREATEAEQKAETLRAAAKRDTQIKLAEYKAEQDKAEAISAQAGPLADAEARKEVVRRETEVASLEADREQKRLDTTVRKPADAAAYAAQVEAGGARDARIALAEASKQETVLSAQAQAESINLTTVAQAEQTQKLGAADASAIRARGEAEAAAIKARAEALAAESDAVIGQQIADKLPEIVAAAAEPFKSISNLTVLNGGQGVTDMLGTIIGSAGPLLDMARTSLTKSSEGDESPVKDVPATSQTTSTLPLPQPRR